MRGEWEINWQLTLASEEGFPTFVYVHVCIVYCYARVRDCSAVLTLRGFCVISSRLVDSRLSFMATYRCLPSSSGSRECRSPAARGSVKRRPFWISSVQKKASKEIFIVKIKTLQIKAFWKCATTPKERHKKWGIESSSSNTWNKKYTLNVPELVRGSLCTSD